VLAGLLACWLVACWPRPRNMSEADIVEKESVVDPGSSHLAARLVLVEVGEAGDGLNWICCLVHHNHCRGSQARLHRVDGQTERGGRKRDTTGVRVGG
jgi:hypothetical protein